MGKAMGVRLNGWQRIGVVLSVLWIVVVGFWRNDAIIKSAQETAEAFYNTCVDAHPYPNDQSCVDEIWKNFELFSRGHWIDAAFVAFVPILIAWLLVWLCVAVFRWVRRGFAPQ